MYIYSGKNCYRNYLIFCCFYHFFLLLFLLLNLHYETILFETMSELKLSKEEIIKAEVMSASRQLFKRYGYQKTTMEDKARAIGRDKSTLYYYGSNEEIFEAILLREAKEFFDTIAKKVEKTLAEEEKLKAYVLTAYQIMSEKAVLNNVILNETIKVEGANTMYPSMMEHIERFNKKYNYAMGNF